jgi:hypothetical protein
VRCLAYWNEFRGRRSFPEQVEELNILTTGLLLFSNSQPTPRKPTEAWKNDSQKEGAKEKSEPVKMWKPSIHHFPWYLDFASPRILFEDIMPIFETLPQRCSATPLYAPWSSTYSTPT